MLHRSWRWLISAVLLSVVALAQAQDACGELVNLALENAGNNCDGLQRNTVCYGYEAVNAAFNQEVDETFFTIPADTALLDALNTITTEPFNPDSENWGVAVLSVQANLPNTLPGQSVTFLLFGDAELENAVTDPFEPSRGLEVRVGAGANIRSGAGTNFNVIGGAPQGAMLVADGISPDGQWLRVAFRERVGWVNLIVIDEDAAIADLPEITPQLQTPMQAVYLRTGIGNTDCNAAPNALVVQGPRNIAIDITINGANVRLGSTGIFFTDVNPQTGQVELVIVTIDGTITVLDENFEPTQTRIFAGQTARACLGDENNFGRNGEQDDRIIACEFSDVTAVDYQLFQANFCNLQQTPLSLLNYNIDIICPGDPPPAPQDNASNGGAAASQSQLSSVDCSGFQALGPFSNINPRDEVTYQWTEAPGATRYELVFYDYNGAPVVPTYFTEGLSQNLIMGGIATGSEFQWEVRAYGAEGYACVTARSPQIVRQPDPAPPAVVQQPSGSFSASFSCGGTGFIDVSYSNAPLDTTSLFVEWESDGMSLNTTISTPELPNGSFSVAHGSFEGNGLYFIEAQPAGVSVFQPAYLDCP